MLFSGIDATAPATPSGGDCAIVGELRRKKIEKLIAKARADTNKAATSARFCQRGTLSGRTSAPDACFHLFPRLSFSGTRGLPRPSLQRLNRCRRSPCFTSHSPRSCKCGCQCRYWHKSSATCPDKRICPASPQSSTRCATLSPAPAMFVSSLTSLTGVTGPL